MGWGVKYCSTDTRGGWNTDTSMNFHTDAHTGMEFNTDTDTATDTMI